MSRYVHGYSLEESKRLHDQAQTLDGLIHHDTCFPSGHVVLEAGCGVGAQTRIIAAMNPETEFVSIDISTESLVQASADIERLGLRNVRFEQGDIFDLDYPDASFDHVFVCFVLEHLSEPVRALNELKRVLKPGGTIVVIEGDHGSTFFYPESEAAYRAIGCQVELQKRSGGNSNIGRQLYPLLLRSGFEDVAVSPRMVYVDPSKPDLVEGFTRNTFTVMIEGVEEEALAQGLISQADFRQGVSDLYRTAEEDGVFCYTFFKAWGRIARTSK